MSTRWQLPLTQETSKWLNGTYKFNLDLSILKKFSHTCSMELHHQTQELLDQLPKMQTVMQPPIQIHNRLVRQHHLGTLTVDTK